MTGHSGRERVASLGALGRVGRPRVLAHVGSYHLGAAVATVGGGWESGRGGQGHGERAVVQPEGREARTLRGGKQGP